MFPGEPVFRALNNCETNRGSKRSEPEGRKNANTTMKIRQMQKYSTLNKKHPKKQYPKPNTYDANKYPGTFQASILR